MSTIWLLDAIFAKTENFNILSNKKFSVLFYAGDL